MGESDGDNLAIILSVIEGTGFDTRKNAIIIKANLGGNALETDAVVPGDLTASFKNNLIWSTNKEAIKRMKEENQPIKLECFVQLTDSRREPIGFVLIPLRTIPFWNSRKMGMMKPHWYKLHGVSQDTSTQKPEILLSVTIGDKDDILNDNEKLLAQHKFDVQNVENMDLDVDILKSDLHVQKVGDNELNIVGIDNSEQYEFLVEICLRYIDKCEHLDINTTLTYMLFDEHKLNLTKNTEVEQLHIDHNISLKFKSSLNDLIAYFRNTFLLPIILTSQENNLKGITQLKFGDNLSILPTSIESFQEIFSAKDLTYQFDSYSNIMFAVSESDEKESNIHYGFSLKFIPVDNKRPSSTTSLLLPHTTLQSASFSQIASSSTPPITTQSQQINDKKRNNMDLNDEQSVEDAISTIPKTFAYTLSLLDCSFNKRPIPGIWQLSLQHPAADSSPVIRNLEISDIVVDQISFEDMNLRLCFTSQPNQLFDLIKSKACVLVLKGPRCIHASAELDNHNILTQEKTKGIVLLETEQNEQIAMAHISVETEELGINFNTDATIKARHQHKIPSSNLYLDENLAYKMIEELEEWKLSQRKEFLTELKRHEIAHLTQLSNEWQRKRRDEELKLQKKIAHCDRLTQTLEEAHNMFKERNRNDVEYEHTLLKTKSDLERCYAKKIDSLNGKIMQMEKENFIREKNEERMLNEIQMDRDKLKLENKSLKAKIKSLEKQAHSANELDENTQEQINELKEYVNLLSDELDKMRKSKMLYKERWAHIVREIQKIKYKNSESFSNDDEDYQRLNELLKSARTDISNE